jgi:hypothetical protein
MTCKGKLNSGLCHNSVSSVFDCGSSGLDLIPGKILFFLMMMSVMALDTAKKAKQSSPATHHGGIWGKRRYSSYSFLTSAIDGGELSASSPLDTAKCHFKSLYLFFLFSFIYLPE